MQVPRERRQHDHAAGKRNASAVFESPLKPEAEAQHLGSLSKIAFRLRRDFFWIFGEVMLAGMSACALPNIGAAIFCCY
ncbi:hypothetical protein [Faunimonas pinastri]|uniref:hypothetical protein n=1 Tax=Faunimonas pinastri TaxID=1855383 RepID=UPI00115FAF68|nr:hypothetical protein [Faunimonas pinastri]